MKVQVRQLVLDPVDRQDLLDLQFGSGSQRHGGQGKDSGEDAQEAEDRSEIRHVPTFWIYAEEPRRPVAGRFREGDPQLGAGDVADRLDIPVLTYGLRTDFQGELFEGSQYLLAWADELQELKTICHTGRKATMVVRMDGEGNAVREGSQVEIGGNDRYVSMCRKHFKKNFYG